MECLSTRGSEPILPARWSLLALLLALSACQGTPTPEESSARKSIQAAESDFRPNGAPPPRIELTPQSPPEDYIRYAIYRNPKVEERFHLWSQAVEQITLARSLPDPSLTFSSEIGRMIESFGPGFTQTFPSRDRLVLAAEAQSHAASARRLEFEREVFRTASRIRTLYFEGAYLEQAITINREILGIATEVETLATSRFRVAQVTLQDVLRPQIERDQIDYEILSLLDSRNTLAARLKEALGMPPAEPDPPLPAAYPANRLELPNEDLLAAAIARNPELRALEAEIREAEALVALARKAGQPDVMVDFELNILSPIFVMPEIGISLPIWRDKIEAGIAAATAFRKAAGARLDAARLEIVMRLAEWLFLYRDANRRLTLLGERLIPKASQSLEIARTSYPTARADLTSLLDAERSLYAFRLAESRARMEREVAVSQVLLELLARLPVPAPFLEAAPTEVKP